MYKWQRDLHMKNDPFYQMIDIDDYDRVRAQAATGEKVEFTSIMGSAAHTYGNVLAFMEKWILDLFPKDFFKTIHINSKIAHRQMIQSDVRAQSKKINPKIIFRPRVSGLDEERFLKGTDFIERHTNTMPAWGGGNLQPFMADPAHNYEIKYLMNRSVMYIDVTCVFNTYIQLLNWMSYLPNKVPVNCPGKLPTCLESYIPTSMINIISDIIQLPVVDDNGCTKEFMDYMNGHSEYPITYKLSGATGNREFYRYYPVNVEYWINDINGDEGEKVGQVYDKYQMTFTVRVEFESTGFYYIFGHELEKYKFRTVDDEEAYSNGNVVPVFTDITCKEDYNLAPGWTLYSQASCRLEEINDHINIKELINLSILKAIEYHEKNGLPLLDFLDIKVRRQGDLLIEGKDYYIDYHTLDIYFHNDTTYFTYKIIVNLNVQYINELVKDLYKLQ